jgi:hypothetical protein
MTVYSTSFQTSPGDMSGQTRTTIAEERMNEGAFVSTDDLPFQGPTVIDGKTGAVKAITDPSQLNPHDRIEVEGIPMTVKQAAELGINLKLDVPTKLSKGMEVTPQARTNQQELEVEEAPSPYTSDAELVAGETMVQAFSFHAGLDRADVEELGTDIALGELRDDDQVWQALSNRGISREAAKGTVERAQQVAAQAARQELGEKGFQELERLAEQSQSIRKLVVKHGINRMNGSANMGWGHVLDLARQFASR